MKALSSVEAPHASALVSSDRTDLEEHEVERVRAFVSNSDVDEVVHHIVKSEQRLRELDERLRHIKLIVDGAKL